MASIMCRFFCRDAQTVCCLAILCSLVTHAPPTQTYSLPYSIPQSPALQMHLPASLASWLLVGRRLGTGRDKGHIFFFPPLPTVMACHWLWVPPSMAIAPDRQSLLPGPAHTGLHDTICSSCSIRPFALRC